MSEIIDPVLKVLAQWPVAEGFFVIVISFLGMFTYRRGEKDRKAGGAGSVELPFWTMAGPLADMFRRVESMEEHSREQTELMRQFVTELRRQNELMEWIGNQAGMTEPPRTGGRRTR